LNSASAGGTAGGNDYLNGGDGADTIRGGPANDFLDGGTGAPDFCDGGVGINLATRRETVVNAIPLG